MLFRYLICRCSTSDGHRPASLSRASAPQAGALSVLMNRDLPLLHVVIFTRKPQLCCYDGGEIKSTVRNRHTPGIDTPMADLHGVSSMPRAKIEGYASTSSQFFHFRRITLNPANRGVIDIHPRSASISPRAHGNRCRICSTSVRSTE
ncbi:hypothetical protein KCP74_04225 [Salmonella enterica subsp. enterica]|nr:hypothetical protein KCP74_04225 [Salmonella enterica subsp. enterica]